MSDDSLREIVDFYTQTQEEARLVFGVEGPGWLVADFDARWAKPAERDHILKVARLLEEEPSIVGASAHLLAMGNRS